MKKAQNLKQAINMKHKTEKKTEYVFLFFDYFFRAENCSTTCIYVHFKWQTLGIFKHIIAFVGNF